jgi:DNA-binding transcriptional MerR regulator
MVGMEVLLTIGEFSKMTYLSVKALRYYHGVGLLEPARIDPSTGYRRYAVSQVAIAQAVRRLRDLEMPVEELRQVLQADDVSLRNQIILAHLERMQEQLERTQLQVASLQALLSKEISPRFNVEFRHIPNMRVLMARANVTFDDCGAWLEPELQRLRETAGGNTAGPDGALYPDEFFESGTGAVTAFVPVNAGGPGVTELPAVTVAVLLHSGSFKDLDQTYGALGTIVAERGIGGPGPVREHYLSPANTEVCWPVISGGIS